ncbi:arginine deiminase [Clostridium weizhouense]|uniref:Arginine deiminase n=1 Tax=Clostridium weizhouense TaxID=2859781 RepID=A0ABS7APL3_9CLOT|nr:arginine deiminase [Clostridium weizhouense]MBW6410601.1 arginine deiminase [Clostridium weizhouense]
MSILVRSEIKELKTVLLHRPGEEIENLTPEYLDRLLFDDIPWLEKAQAEHDAFANVLRDNGVEVLYLHELMAEVIDNKEIRDKFINQFIKEAEVLNPHMIEKVTTFLNSIKDTKELVRKTMSGIRKDELPKVSFKEVELADLVDDEYPFITDPMPNLYFTRDPFASIGDKISLHKMYSVTRGRETIYAEYIFNYHPRFKDTKKVYDRYFPYSLEGGDVLNISDEVLAVGISQRTSPQGLQRLAKEIFFNTKGNKIKTILGFDIPKSRAYMHLDTVFTQVDYNKFTIHPQIQGPLKVFEITKGEDEKLVINEVNMELEKVLAKHLHRDDIVLIQCGGGDYITSQREQWNDGSNTLCIRPGEVVVYSRNYVTNKILEENGVKIYVVPSSELSRGRGGPRCMSMPLIREE